jgi:hypothetical protein
MHIQPSPAPHRWRWLILGPALCSLSCSGSGGLHPVHGQVLYKDRPLQGAVVTFHPRGADEVTAVRPVGLTGEDGTFTLTTGPQDGAPAGAYVVTVICPQRVAPQGNQGFSTAGPDTRDRFGGAYADRATSALAVEIQKGPNQLEPFHLK